MFCLILLSLFILQHFFVIPSFILLWSERICAVISVSLNWLKFALCPSMWSILETLLLETERNVYSVVLE